MVSLDMTKNAFVACMLFLLSLQFVGCGKFIPYMIPEEKISYIKYTNKEEAIKMLNNFKYTSNYAGAQAVTPAVTLGGGFPSEKKSLPHRIIFFDTYLEYHSYKRGRYIKTVGSFAYYEIDPSFTKIEYNEIKEIWITGKADLTNAYIQNLAEGEYCINFSKGRGKGSYAVVITQDIFYSYLKAAITVFPSAKLYQYKTPKMR